MTAKPVLYCCNVGEGDLPNGNAWSDSVKARAAKEGAGVVVLCGKVEAELAELSAADRAELLASYGLKEPALATLARECYRLLGLQSYFTAGEKEIRAWTIRKGAMGPEAAGVIHTDFEKGFIRAQVYSLDGSRASTAARPRSRRPASCASKARSTSCRTATSCTSCSTCDARAARISPALRWSRSPRPAWGTWSLFLLPTGLPAVVTTPIMFARHGHRAASR